MNEYVNFCLILVANPDRRTAVVQEQRAATTKYIAVGTLLILNKVLGRSCLEAAA